MKNNLFKISAEEYMEKVNERDIDCEFDTFYMHSINKFLRSKIWEPRGYFNHPQNLKIYDNIYELRLPTLTEDYPKSIGGAFTTSHVDVESIPDIIKEQCVNQDYKIYLVNPRLYRYFVLGTVSLVHFRNLDKKCIEAWVGHDKLKIIDNSTDFDEKINRLLSEIHFAIGDPLPIEIERKFLIKKPNIEAISKLYPVAVCDIFQFWLTENSLNTDERRVRSYGIDNNYTYYYTVKKQYNEGRIEIEERISEKEFLRFLPDMKSKLSKKRYCIAYDSQYIKLDIFDFEQDLAIVEVELSDITNEVNLPEAFEVIKEVTNDENYLNKNIALRKMLEYY